MPDLVRFGITVPAELRDRFDAAITRHQYANRSEALRDLMRGYLIETAWGEGKETVGAVAIVYDHHQRELSQRLTHLQHDHTNEVISSMHVHLDHENCLEVIVLRGDAANIRRLADQLISAKGVKHGRLIGTGTGAEG